MIEMKVTEKQRELWISAAERNIAQTLDEIEYEQQLYTIVFEDEYRTLKADLIKAGDGAAFMADVTFLTYYSEIYQVFTGNADWSTHIIFTNKENGEILVDVQWPQENWKLTPDMWD